MRFRKKFGRGRRRFGRGRRFHGKRRGKSLRHYSVGRGGGRM